MKARRTPGVPIAHVQWGGLQGRNEVEDPGSAGVAARRDGPTGLLRPPARLGPEAHASAHRALSARTGKARPRARGAALHPFRVSDRKQLCWRDAAGDSSGAKRNQSAVRHPEQGRRRRPARCSPPPHRYRSKTSIAPTAWRETARYLDARRCPLMSSYGAFCILLATFAQFKLPALRATIAARYLVKGLSLWPPIPSSASTKCSSAPA